MFVCLLIKKERIRFFFEEKREDMFELKLFDVAAKLRAKLVGTWLSGKG